MWQLIVTFWLKYVIDKQNLSTQWLQIYWKKLYREILNGLIGVKIGMRDRGDDNKREIGTVCKLLNDSGLVWKDGWC